MSGAETRSEVRFSTAVYSIDTVKKAAYRFSDRCSFNFSLSGAEIVCTLEFPPNYTTEKAADVKNGFRNEVLDQDLRQSIAAETEHVRNTILAYAFSKTGLQRDGEV